MVVVVGAMKMTREMVGNVCGELGEAVGLSRDAVVDVAGVEDVAGVAGVGVAVGVAVGVGAVVVVVAAAAAAGFVDGGEVGEGVDVGGVVVDEDVVDR